MALPTVRPRSQVLPTQLVRLTPSPRTHMLIAVLLGIEGPKEIVKKDSTKTLLATLYVADDTLPRGMEVIIWGRQALQTANLRIMDVIQVKQVFVEKDRFRGTVIKFRGDGCVTSVCGGYNDIVARLVEWRGSMYNELLGFAERGRLRSREWGDGGRVMKSLKDDDGTLRCVTEHGGVKEVDFVHITSIRIRIPRKATGSKGDEVAAIRALCRKICTRCRKRLDGETCVCGNKEWKWGFGWLIIGLRDGSGEFMATVEGEVLGRLLFGVSIEDIMGDDDVARVCCGVLESLVKDGGCFRVAVQARNKHRLRLLHLFV